MVIPPWVVLMTDEERNEFSLFEGDVFLVSSVWL